MNKFSFYILFLVGFSIASCVPTKDLVYLQKKDNSKPETVESIVVKPYRLQTNDILSVQLKAIDPKLVEIFNQTSASGASVANGPESGLYFNGYTVDDHGNIRLPLLGELNVLGFTIDETRLKIENKLKEEYFKEQAHIFVIVKLSGFRYTINGEVGSTGTKVLFQEKVNILEAIANSGDIQITGNRKDVKVIRRFPQGSETFSIDLTDSNAVNSPVFYLQPNDYIYVKPLKQKTWGTGKTGLESVSTIITLISLVTTTLVLINR
jgi:polysaccharide biosynthesis/export protein